MRILYDHIIILSASGASTRMDMTMLRRIGVSHLTQCQTPEKSLETIKNAQADLLICQDSIGTTPIQIFLEEMRWQNVKPTLPVLIVSGNVHHAKRLQALGLSCLLRPFTQADLANAMSQAKNINILPRPHKAPEKCATGKNNIKKTARIVSKTPSDLLDMGAALLSNGDTAGAMQCFLGTLVQQPDHPQAHLSLANLYRRTGQTTLYQSHLLRAAAGLVRRGQTEQAKFATKYLPTHIREGNIFAYEALFYMDSGEYRQAARSFLEAAKFEPDKRMHVIISRACQFTTNPENSLESTCIAFEEMGKAALAAHLRQRLLTDSDVEHASASSWLDKFPNLRDALHIASYTAYAWRQA